MLDQPIEVCFIRYLSCNFEFFELFKLCKECTRSTILIILKARNKYVVVRLDQGSRVIHIFGKTCRNKSTSVFTVEWNFNSIELTRIRKSLPVGYGLFVSLGSNLFEKFRTV